MKNHIRHTRRLYSLICIVCLIATPLRSEVTLDGSTGPARVVSGPDYQITEDLGQRTGSNLFHSFGRFNLNKTESAIFSGSPDIRNVISRVTGGQSSTIDGLLKSTIANANMYFINPAGIFFGENARIDVPGSFHTSTANYLGFTDGVRFDSSNSTVKPVLTTASPESFGFLGNNAPGKITVSGGENSILEVKLGKTLSLIGGDITIKNSTLFAPGGQVNLASVDSVGEVIVSKNTINTTTFSKMGTIHIIRDTDAPRTTADIDVSADKAGKIFIRSGQLVVDKALITANTKLAAGGDITILLTGDLAINGNGALPGGEAASPSSSILTATSGTGTAGNIVIDVDGLKINKRALIGSSTTGAGNAGNLRIKGNNIEIDAKGGILNATFSIGHAGGITIDAGQLDIHNGGQVIVTTLNSGNSGDLMINADHLKLDNGGFIASVPLQSINENKTTGKAGDIKLDATFIELDNASGILSTAVSATKDGDIDGIDRVDSGKITLFADGIKLSNKSRISTNTLRSGNGGELKIDTVSLEINNATVSTSTAGKGQAGKLEINADNILLQSASIKAISSLKDVDPLKPTEAMSGTIEITANKRLQLNNASKITVETEQANAGDITINGEGVLILSRNSGIETSVANGNKKSGDIEINSPILSLDTSGILANADQGSGGDITIKGLVFESPGSRIAASSASEVDMDGLVTLKPDTTISGSISVLPSAVKSVDDQLSKQCATRSGASSSFVTKGRGNMPVAPGNLMPSNLLDYTPLERTKPKNDLAIEASNSDQSFTKNHSISKSANKHQYAAVKTGCGNNTQL